MSSRKLLAAILVVLSPGFVVPASEPMVTAILSGAVFSAPSGTPLAGATVYAVDPESGQVYPSESSAGDGTFVIRGLPAKTLELGVEVDNGLYLVQTPVSLVPAQQRSIHLAVTSNAKRKEGQHSSGYTKSRSSVWSHPVTAAFIVVGAALVLGVLIHQATDEEDEASPFGA